MNFSDSPLKSDLQTLVGNLTDNFICSKVIMWREMLSTDTKP